MKVVLVPASSDLVGVAVHVHNLAKLLYCEGMLDLVVCPRDGWLPRQLEQSGLPCKVMQISPRATGLLAANLRFGALLRELKTADIVHLHGRFPLFVSALSLLMDRRQIFVATIHQFTERALDGPGSWKARLEGLLLRGMQRICCVSADLRAEVIGRIGSERAADVEVIPNWIEPVPPSAHDGCMAEANAKINPFKICAIGYLTHIKGFDILVQAVAAMYRHGHKVHCDIFGQGPEKAALLEMAKKLDVLDLVSFKDPTPDLRALLPSYRAVVVPSRSESFSIVALEAYDASVPVIASNVRGLRETVVDGQTGLLFESGNYESLGERITVLLASDTLRQRLVANAREHLRTYSRTEGLKKAYLEFYSKALAHGGKRAVPIGNVEVAGK